jgi:predicted membrane-bound mannosyltransferase
MSVSSKETEEWRLGEPGAHDVPEQSSEEPGALHNYSAERLERPLWVVTAEHLGWATVGILAIASRLVMLGARPLNSVEAGHALGELALLRSGPPAGAHLSWIHLLQAALFASVGAGDFKARAIFALSGLLLIASSLGMRRQLGRAGAMAFAGLLVLSPSVAYFSRATDSVVPALAFAVLALAMFLELADEPGRIVAAGLGGAIGLGLASDASALMTALFMLAALAIVGLLAALAGTRLRLQVRVWWTRRKGLFLITTLVAAVVWLGCESGFFTHSPVEAIVAAFRSNLPSNLLQADPGDHRGFTAGLDFYLPILSLYEFFVVFLALIGALSVLTLRVRSRLATAALLWSALAIAFCLWTPARSPALMVQMIVPMALLGAFVIEALHHTVAWSILRYPLAVLALLTLSVQVANNFIWYAPDASQAPWARTALLYWTTPATTLQTPVECARVISQLPPHKASAFFANDSPVLRWYLRALIPAGSAEGADAIVGSTEPAALSQAQGLTTYEFELDDVWHPAWWSLSPRAAMHYLASARPWTPLDSHRVTIAARPMVTLAPTVILAPVAPPPAAGSAASAASSGSEGQSVPQASASATAASPAPSASVTPALGTAPESQPSATLASTPASTTASTPVATPAATPTAATTPAAVPSFVPTPEPAATASPVSKRIRHRRHPSAGLGAEQPLN